MKNLIISLFFCVFFFSTVSAQIGKGYYVTFENDTVYVDFIGSGLSKPNLQEMTWNAIYLNKEGKRVDLSPKVAKEIFFEFKNTGNKYRLVSLPNTLEFHSPPNRSGRRYFAEALIEGKLSLYLYIKTHGMPGTIPFGYDRIRVWLINGKFYDLSRRKTWKQYPQILSDCPKLIEMIKNKDKRVKTYVKITEMYNSLCGEEDK